MKRVTLLSLLVLQSAWSAAPQSELIQAVSPEQATKFGNLCLKEMGVDEHFEAVVLPTSVQSETNTPGYADPLILGFGPHIIKVSRQRGSGELESACFLQQHLDSQFGDQPIPDNLPRIINIKYFSVISP
ncbi:MAG: hypothetical protein LBL30_00950 [Holosporales bacterium]|jgi:hypothetical protein|nr:hypothetical protein [Holosporales bacterium]